MNKPWVVILAFLGVFAAGTVSGTLLGARYGRQIFPRSRPSGGNYSTQLMQRFSEQLNLTADQTEKIRPIVDKTGFPIHRFFQGIAPGAIVPPPLGNRQPMTRS